MPTKKAIVASMSKKELQRTLEQHRIAYKKSSNKTVLQEIINKQLKKSQLLRFSGGAIQHCDIKPENIMMCKDVNGELQAKLIDFGLANLDDKKICPGGTIYFMPYVFFGDEDPNKNFIRDDINDFLDFYIPNFLNKETPITIQNKIRYNLIKIFYTPLAETYKAVSEQTDVNFFQDMKEGELKPFFKRKWKETDRLFVKKLYEKCQLSDTNSFVNQLHILKSAVYFAVDTKHANGSDFKLLAETLENIHNRFNTNQVNTYRGGNASELPLIKPKNSAFDNSKYETTVENIKDNMTYALTYHSLDKKFFRYQDIYAKNLTLFLIRANQYAVNKFTKLDAMYDSLEFFPSIEPKSVPPKQAFYETTRYPNPIVDNKPEQRDSDILQDYGGRLAASTPSTKRLGNGAFGTVYLSNDGKNAIKVVSSNDEEKQKIRNIAGPLANSYKYTLLKDPSFYKGTGNTDDNTQIIYTLCDGKDLFYYMQEQDITDDMYNKVKEMLDWMCKSFLQITIP